jgi:hypothetical protein
MTICLRVRDSSSKSKIESVPSAEHEEVVAYLRQAPCIVQLDFTCISKPYVSRILSLEKASNYSSN